MPVRQCNECLLPNEVLCVIFQSGKYSKLLSTKIGSTSCSGSSKKERPMHFLSTTNTLSSLCNGRPYCQHYLRLLLSHGGHKKIIKYGTNVVQFLQIRSLHTARTQHAFCLRVAILTPSAF